MPTVARVPRGPMVTLAPLGPMESEAPDLLRLMESPGAIRIRLKNLKGKIGFLSCASTTQGIPDKHADGQGVSECPCA